MKRTTLAVFLCLIICCLFCKAHAATKQPVEDNLPSPIPAATCFSDATNTKTIFPIFTSTDPSDRLTADTVTLEPSIPVDALRLNAFLGGYIFDNNTAYIFHVTFWTTTGKDNAHLTSQVARSLWYVYRYSGGGHNNKGQSLNDGSLEVQYTPQYNGDQPLLHATSSAYLISIQVFEGVTAAKQIAVLDTKVDTPASLTYSISVTKQTAANQSDLSLLLTTLFGVKTQSLPQERRSETASATPTQFICLATSPIKGTQLPYDITITATVDTVQTKSPELQATATPTPTASQSPELQAQAKQTTPNPGNTGTPTPTPGPKMAQTFHALDREWWDLGIGIVTVPLRQTVISSTGTLSSQNVINPYGLFNVYPMAWSHWTNGDIESPHLQIGLPLSGQPLHRPYAGIGEPLPLLEKYIGFPISVFGGIDFMRVEYTANTPHWVKKRVIGIELPLSKLISKVNPIKSK